MTINNHGVLWYPIITQKFFHPKKLWTATSSSNIFYFCSRQRDRILLFTHPSNKIGSYIKTSTNGAFSIIDIAGSIWIRKSSKRQIWLFVIEQSIITSSTNIFYDSFNSVQVWNLRIRLKPMKARKCIEKHKSLFRLPILKLRLGWFYTNLILSAE